MTALPLEATTSMSATDSRPEDIPPTTEITREESTVVLLGLRKAIVGWRLQRSKKVVDKMQNRLNELKQKQSAKPIKNIGNFLMYDLPNILGPNEPPLYTSDHYQKYLDLLEREANGFARPESAEPESATQDSDVSQDEVKENSESESEKDPIGAPRMPDWLYGFSLSILAGETDNRKKKDKDFYYKYASPEILVNSYRSLLGVNNEDAAYLAKKIFQQMRDEGIVSASPTTEELHAINKEKLKRSIFEQRESTLQGGWLHREDSGDPLSRTESGQHKRDKQINKLPEVAFEDIMGLPERTLRYIAGQYRTDKPNVPFPSMSVESLISMYERAGFTKEKAERFAPRAFSLLQEYGIIAETHTRGVGFLVNADKLQTELRNLTDERVKQLAEARKTLPELDKLELELASLSPKMQKGSKGATLRKRIDQLTAKYKLRQILVPINGTFDPNYHNAIEVEGEGNEEVIKKVYRAGYLLDDTLVRAADVKVIRRQKDVISENPTIRTRNINGRNERQETRRTRGKRKGDNKSSTQQISSDNAIELQASEPEHKVPVPTGHHINIGKLVRQKRAMARDLAQYRIDHPAATGDDIVKFLEQNRLSHAASYFGITHEDLRQGKIVQKELDEVIDLLRRPLDELQRINEARRQRGRRYRPQR